MEELQDAIEDAQYVHAIASQDDGPKPVVAWPKPSPEELEAWRKNKLVASVQQYDKRKGSSTAVPFSIEWVLQQEIGLFLFSAFLKEVAKDYCRINFCEQVYRFKASAGGRKTLELAQSIVDDFLVPPEIDSGSQEPRKPTPTEINESDLFRERPLPPPFNSSQLNSAFEENVEYPKQSESIIGVKGSIRMEAVAEIRRWEEKRPPEAPPETSRAAALTGTPPASFSIFDKIEVLVLESLKQQYWSSFLESSQHQRLLDFLWYQDRPVVPDDFFPMRVLGRGGFGLVKGVFYWNSALPKFQHRVGTLYLTNSLSVDQLYFIPACKKGTSGKLYAMKIMDKRRIKMKKSEHLTINERRALAAVDSKFVVNLKYAFHSTEDVFLILEMMTGGDLGYHLSDKGRFHKKQCLFYAARIMLALQALHDKGYVFRDLKPENCLLAEDGRVKITDLGLATKITPKLHGAAGTRGYWAPEMLRRDAKGKRMVYGHTVDWFSFGCCLAEFISGKNPFRSEAALSFGQSAGMMTKEKAIDHATLEMDPDFSSALYEPDAADLLRKLLLKDEKQRIGFSGCKEIMEHPYFKTLKWEDVIADREDPPFVPLKDVNAMSQAEIGAFAEDKIYQETVITDQDEKYYADWDWTNPKAYAAEVIEFLVYERETGVPLLPLAHHASCCCDIL